MKRRNWWAIIIALTLAWIFYKSSGGTQPVSVSPTQLIDLIKIGSVKEIVFYQDTKQIQVTINAKSAKGKSPSVVQVITIRALTDAQLNKILESVEKAKVPYRVENPPGTWFGMLSSLIFPLIMIWFFWNMSRSMSGAGKGGISDFLNKPIKKHQGSQVKITFAEVAGCDEAKEELQEMVNFLKNPGQFTQIGARIPKGALLLGPPGTGKTLLAKAVAGEANVPFFPLSGSDFVEMFVGVGANRVRSLFEQAKKNAPCIVFIDEIDAVGKGRGRGMFSGPNDEREQTLNALLVEMDGFDGRSGIIILGATNRPDSLDPALVRPGRFDRQVHISNPDLNAREAILKVHSKKVALGADVNLRAVAQDATGMSGAELENVINEAALLAARQGKKFVEQVDLSNAVDKVTMGPERKSMKLKDSEKKNTAFHEAGHALIATLTKGADPVHKVTIMPRGPALGFVRQEQEDRYSHTKESLLAVLAVLCAGRAAEEITFGAEKITTGASNDFERATALVRNMVCAWGMGKSGLVVHQQKLDNYNGAVTMDVSDNTKKALEKEIKKTLHKVYDDVKVKLKEKKDKLAALAQALLEKETLTGDEVRAIVV